MAAKRRKRKTAKRTTKRSKASQINKELRACQKKIGTIIKKNKPSKLPKRRHLIDGKFMTDSEVNRYIARQR